MPLSCEELEPRLAPVGDLGGGVARVRDVPLFEVMPFPGFAGPLSVLDAGDRVYVGDGSRWVGYEFGPAFTVSAASGSEVSVGDASWFAVFLDFEGPGFDRIAYTLAVADYFSGLPIRFTDTRPAAPPGAYGTAVIGAPVAWQGFAAGGYAPTDDFARTGDEWTAREVYVGGGGPAVAAHEIGHGFGLPHKRGTVMDANYLGPAFDADERAAIGGRLTGGR